MTLDANRCTTCGDVAVTATVVHVDGLLAVVEAGGAVEQVAIDLVEPVVVGELLLCHAGIALERVTVSP
jgi:hydrogenase maturation factor